MTAEEVRRRLREQEAALAAQLQQIRVRREAAIHEIAALVLRLADKEKEGLNAN